MVEKRNNLTKILNFMKDKNKVHIKDIYNGTNINKNSIMGCINKYVLLNMYFMRLGNGYYKLKEEVIINGNSNSERPDGKEFNETKKQNTTINEM